jgi:zinc transporter ZupT
MTIDGIIDQFVLDSDPIIPTIISLLVTWGSTGLGAAVMFCVPEFPDWVMGIFYAIMGGMLTATAAMGLLTESIARADRISWCKWVPWVPPLVGFLLGVGAMQAITASINILHAYLIRDPPPKTADEEQSAPEAPLLVDPSHSSYQLQMLVGEEGQEESSLFVHDARAPMKYRISKKAADLILEARGPEAPPAAANTAFADALVDDDELTAKKLLQRTIILVLALILQQIPEGAMTGIAFANAWKTNGVAGSTEKAMRVAFSASLGTWLTSFAEGMAVMLTLRGVKVNKTRSFIFVMIASMLETIAGILGCMITSHVEQILPFALASVAASLMFTVSSEIMPQANEKARKTIVTLGYMFSFAMMVFVINLFP